MSIVHFMRFMKFKRKTIFGKHLAFQSCCYVILDNRLSAHKYKKKGAGEDKTSQTLSLTYCEAEHSLL